MPKGDPVRQIGTALPRLHVPSFPRARNCKPALAEPIACRPSLIQCGPPTVFAAEKTTRGVVLKVSPNVVGPGSSKNESELVANNQDPPACRSGREKSIMRCRKSSSI
jgi:hypothetical protein